MSSTTSKKLIRFAAAAATLGSLGALATHQSANADPKQFTALKGFGSDTVEQVTNAFAGFNNGTTYLPLVAGPDSQQLVSWDATPDNQCIAVLPGAPGIHRPNGSGEGLRMLSHADNGDNYGNAATCGVKGVGGLIDFSRSSSQVTGTTVAAIAAIPFGRDALSFAYYDSTATSTFISATKAQLAALYTSGPQLIGGKVVVPCGIQTGSGTKTFWESATGTAATENAATTLCRLGDTTGTAPVSAVVTVGDASGRIEENNGVSLKAKGTALQSVSDPLCDGVAGGSAVSCAGVQVVIGFSAANFIAKVKGVSSGTIPADVDLGSITDDGNVPTPANLGAPYSGTRPNLSPSATFYASGVFGRNVYYLVPNSVLTGPGEFGLKAMFTDAGNGGTAVICGVAAQSTVAAFGFLANSECGDIKYYRGYDLGQPS